MIRSILVVICILATVACTPSQTIKPLPNFVEAGLESGDRIVVTTRDGQTHAFVVSDIRDQSIYGEQYRIPFSEIVQLQKKSWSRPKSPCGGDKPLGCSVPLLISLSSEDHSHYENVFHNACAQHDYCYRHGFRSYGVDRDTCDEEFLNNMHAACPDPADNLFTKTLQFLDDSVESRQTCLAMARDFHAAVRRFGEKKFKTDSSTYCEYDGPPHDKTE